MEQASTQKEKQLAYSREYKQYRKAMKEEFFLEAVSIGYAIIEDRLVAFLHHAGIVTRDRDDLKVNHQVYPYMRKLLGRDNRYRILIKNLSVKISVVQELLNLTEERARAIDSEVEAYISSLNRKKTFARPGYMTDLHRQMLRLDYGKSVTVTNYIDAWRNDRNRLVHALMRQNPNVAIALKRDCAERSYEISRNIDDTLVKPFKKNNQLRKKYNIQ